MQVSLWIAFAVAYMGITLSPGPNVMIVLTHAAKYGFRHIYVTIAGNLTCQLLIITAIGLGVGALLTVDTVVYHWMKYVGAAYLVYLGVRIVYNVFVKGRATNLNLVDPGVKQERLPSFRRRYLEGVAVSASNPKTVIFLSAFLPQFVSRDMPIFPQFAIMFLTIAMIVTTIHSVYALLLIVMKARLSGSLSSRFFPGLTAAIYLFLGASLGWSA
ncbi:LysE family translocator [Rhizobium paknamense]|uniref:Threonine/homoserine/homoserine lactone efflux protein n=1 Tax=Rhizobium paknamense TaxID=1206817 RepID=A0ABU0I9B4_9HYPH|nr:LysE family translocator [Rhizobium paknamense]MDQ0454831.1 threonine/homoserine/homoserine lactone efflux protein [Rhizobium paknamense]